MWYININVLIEKTIKKLPVIEQPKSTYSQPNAMNNHKRISLLILLFLMVTDTNAKGNGHSFKIGSSPKVSKPSPTKTAGGGGMFKSRPRYPQVADAMGLPLFYQSRPVMFIPFPIHDVLEKFNGTIVVQAIDYGDGNCRVFKEFEIENVIEIEAGIIFKCPIQQETNDDFDWAMFRHVIESTLIIVSILSVIVSTLYGLYRLYLECHSKRRDSYSQYASVETIV